MSSQPPTAPYGGRVRRSRRAIVKICAVALAGRGAGHSADMAAAQPALQRAQPANPSSPESTASPLCVRLTLNGREHMIMVDSHTDVLDVLR